MIKFCPKCHREAYRMIDRGEQILITQNSRNVMNIGKNSCVKMNLQCPVGHDVWLRLGTPAVLTEEEKKEIANLDTPEDIKQHILDSVKG
jgi:hypothetical protein